jgi:hypothetical protein
LFRKIFKNSEALFVRATFIEIVGKFFFAGELAAAIAAAATATATSCTTTTTSTQFNAPPMSSQQVKSRSFSVFL